MEGRQGQSKRRAISCTGGGLFDGAGWLQPTSPIHSPALADIRLQGIGLGIEVPIAGRDAGNAMVMLESGAKTGQKWCGFARAFCPFNRAVFPLGGRRDTTDRS